MTREQLQQIRDALEYWHEIETSSGSVIDYTDELDILDAALAAPEPQPVAWQERQIIGKRDGVYKWSHWYSCGYRTDEVAKARTYSTQYEWRPLYTRPMPEPSAPQREWVGLTDEEINNCAGAEIYPSTWAMAFARAIESKLKEKNHG